MASAAELSLSEDYNLLTSEKHTIPISSSAAVEVYSNTNPCNLKIGCLQKGLIFTYEGTERVGEGTGFGFPVLMYPKETYFSSSAKVWMQQTSGSIKIKKEFIMDRVARNKVGNARLENQQARTFIRILTDLYQKNKRFRFLAIKEIIVNMGIQNTFVKTVSIGTIPVTYEITNCTVNVKVDFRQLRKKHPRKIFVLNEQSGGFFRRYADSYGSVLVDGHIGAWDTVDADWACLTDLRGRIGFRLWNVGGCVFRRGRETMKNCLDWSGLDYEVDPKSEVFEYHIDLFGVEP
jgi:hypothetical protein